MIVRAGGGGRDRLTKQLSMGLTLSLYPNPHEVNSYAAGAMPGRS